MVDVDIHNFQSIDHVHLRVEGFTALVGRSNIGKSAIVRAVKAALTGAPEDNYVRHGATCEKTTKGTKSCKCFCSVHIKAEGFDLLWRKGGDKNEYVYNGQTYTAANKGTPEFLVDSFGPVNIGDHKVILQVADQFRSEGGGPIFLLDEYGATIADVLSDVANLDRINVAARMAEKDRRECAAQRKVREKDIIDLKTRSVSYDGLDDVLARVKGVEDGEKRLMAQRTRRDDLRRFKETVKTVGPQIKALMEVPKVVIPEFPPLGSIAAKVKIVLDYLGSVEGRQAIVLTLIGVDAVDVPTIEPIRNAWVKLQNLSGWVAKIRSHKDFFAKWKEAEGCASPDLEPLRDKQKGYASLGDMRRRYLATETQVTLLEKQFAGIEREFQEVKNDEANLGVCPTCLQLVSVDHDHAAE
jgi:hypothetical protein